MAHKLIEEALKRGYVFGVRHFQIGSSRSVVIYPQLYYDEQGVWTGCVWDGNWGIIYCPVKGWAKFYE